MMKRSIMPLAGIAAVALAAAKDKGDAAPQTAKLSDGLDAAGILAEVAASENGEVLMTQEQAAAGIAAGHLEVDTSRAADGYAPVKLSEAGFAAFQASEHGDANRPAGSTDAAGTRNVTTPPAGGYVVESGVAPPAGASASRGRSGGYPFEALNIADGAEYGDSFHVPKTTENPDPAARLASSVTGARIKYAEETGQTEEVTVIDYQRVEGGKAFAKDAEGKRIKTGERKETRPVTRLTRDFMVKEVGADDPKGPGARVWRIAVK